MTTQPDFQYCLDRTIDGEGEIELAIEVKHYQEPENTNLDHRDPNYSPGEVEFGNAVVADSGRTIVLTPMEWEAVETAFWK